MSWDEREKARRRLSREKGTIIKDWGGRIPIALIYPNSYYVGMSNLGLHAIYSLLNSRRQIVAERAFWEKETSSRQLPALSLERQRPLSDFAVLAFSITYELDYLNVPQILKASGIPLHAADRDGRHPLVIAGGPPVTVNPMPLAPFFDCLCIGEAEPILPPMLDILSETISGRRADMLQALASLPGVYVPAYNTGTTVSRQWAKNLDDLPVHSVVLTPDTELGGLYLIEVERGCSWDCRFCLVSSAFRPMRLRSAGSLIEQAEQGLKHRKRIGLVGPAVSDHPQIEELLARLLEMGAELSISSLRISSLSGKLIEQIAEGGAQSIAIAPEAGSQRLRQAIKKGVSEDAILATVGMAGEYGLKQLKLYFMIGLPTETDEDIEAITKLTLKAKSILDRQHSGTRLTLNIAPFVPKAGTPCQWLPMAHLPILNRRLSRLKSVLPPKGIKVKSESPAWSQIQAVFARGDVKLAEVLANMEQVSLAGWRQAAAECNLDVDFYAHQRWDTNQKLPWAMIDSGIKPNHLEGELNEALSEDAKSGS